MSEVTGMSSNNAETPREVSDHPSAPAQPESVASGGHSAGALLRQARQAQGLHIGALAASLKVPQRKLEALEADRYEELTDITFVRALAQTVCRALKVDPVPVLGLLPQTLDPKLDRLANGLNQPFRERPGHGDSKRLTWLRRPGPLVALALLLATAVVYLAPSGLWSDLANGVGDRASQRVPAASAAAEGVFPPSTSLPVNAEAGPVLQALPDAGASSVAPSEPAPASTPAAAAALSKSAPLQLRASAQTWVEVLDANDHALMSRNLDSGEELALDGALPLKIRIGNAAGIAVQFRGQAVDLTPYTRGNVARFELK